jgi:hypothetical protein
LNYRVGHKTVLDTIKSLNSTLAMKEIFAGISNQLRFGNYTPCLKVPRGEATTEVDDELDCIACLVPTRDRTTCNHPVCRQCLGIWLINHFNCPVCRKYLR